MSGCRDVKDLSRAQLFVSQGHGRSALSGYEEEHHRQMIPAEVQQLSGIKEEPPEHQDYASDLDLEDTKPLNIKEEQGELWSSQEGEQLQGLEEAKFQFTPVFVKSESDEDKPQPSELHQGQTDHRDTYGENCEGPEPAWNSDLERHLQPVTEVEIEGSSEPETEDSDDYCEDTRDCQPGLNMRETSLKTNKKLHSCSLCGKTFKRNSRLTKHMINHTQEKHLSCSECGKTFKRNGHLTKHMINHTEEKCLSCSECGKTFTQKGTLNRHMITHSGEKPFSCSWCNKSFYSKENMTQHVLVHTGEKPFSCSVCGKRFTQGGNLARHTSVHTGEKPFSCSECGKKFTQKGNLTKHTLVHTGEKPFSCSECGKRFTQKGNLTQHMSVHREKKPFSCSVCGKRFKEMIYQIRHIRIHREKPCSSPESGQIIN